MTRVIVITGPPAIGKTTVTEHLAECLEGVVAHISGDVFILAVTPFEISDDRRRFLRENLASFARHAIEHGYDWVVIECVIPSDEFLRELAADIGVSTRRMAVISLLANREVYERRLQLAVANCDVPPADFKTCHEWMERIRRLRIPTPIDTTNEPAKSTAAEACRIACELP